MQSKAVVAWETQLWKRKILLQGSSTISQTPLLVVCQVCTSLLALDLNDSACALYVCQLQLHMQGSRPPVIFSFSGSREVYVVQTKFSSETKAKDRQFAIDLKKNVVAIAGHPHDASVIFHAHEDATICGSCLNVTQHTLTTLWTFTVDERPTSIHKVCCSC